MMNAKTNTFILFCGTVLMGALSGTMGAVQPYSYQNSDLLQIMDDLFVKCYEISQSASSPFPLEIVDDEFMWESPSGDICSLKGRMFKKAMEEKIGLPGPCLMVDRGSTVFVDFINEIEKFEPFTCLHGDPQPPNGLEECSGAGWTPTWISNLHTHGLHVSPIAPADDPRIQVGTDETYSYKYDIPSDHMGGLHWYHPHSHGSISSQLAGGAAGFVIVRDEPEIDNLPSCLSDIPQRLLMLHPIDPNILNTIALETSDPNLGFDSTQPDGCPKATGQDSDKFVLVNGLQEPDIELTSNAWQRWRVVNSGVDNYLRFRPEGNVCQMRLLAKDGVYIQDLFRSVNHIVLPPGGRSDFLIRCTGETSMIDLVSAEPDIMKDRKPALFEGKFATIVIKKDALNYGDSDSENDRNYRVEDITVEDIKDYCGCNGDYFLSESDESVSLPVYPLDNYQYSICPTLPKSNVSDYQTCTPSYPPYLSDLCHLPESWIDYYWKFSDGGTTDTYTINNVPFNPDVNLAKFELCSIMEYDLYGVWEHPIHIHVNHFQLPLDADIWVDQDYFRECDFHDTFLWLGPHHRRYTISVRQLLADFHGEWALHCHIITHEDLGMFGFFDVEYPSTLDYDKESDVNDFEEYDGEWGQGNDQQPSRRYDVSVFGDKNDNEWGQDHLYQQPSRRYDNDHSWDNLYQQQSRRYEENGYGNDDSWDQDHLDQKLSRRYDANKITYYDQQYSPQGKNVDQWGDYYDTKKRRSGILSKNKPPMTIEDDELNLGQHEMINGNLRENRSEMKKPSTTHTP